MLRGRADTALPGTIVYIHLGDTLVAQDAWQWRSPFGRTYFHTDHLGTPLARSDFTGTVFERTRRQSFGQPLVGPLKDGPGYTGHMEDPGTGLVYMQQRYYDPTIASFLSVDPVGPLADPSNHFGRYHYALNNPYRYTDPDGRVPLDTLVDVGYLIYDGGRFLGAAGAAGVGALTGNEALTSEGLAGMLATSGDLASSAASVVTPYASAPMARMGKEVAEAVEQTTRETKVRPSAGGDGGVSAITIERNSSGEAISRTHQVTRDGEVVHQHQEHIGKSGSEQRFPDEWTGTETINAPEERVKPR